jgi:hypothetical protein
MFRQLIAEAREALDEGLPKWARQGAAYHRAGAAVGDKAGGRKALQAMQKPDPLAARQKDNEGRLARMRAKGQKLIGGKSPFAANLIRRK